MEHWLDDLARGLAGGVSRRRALGRFAALLGGAALATAVPAVASADSDDGDHRGPCDEFCEQLPKDQRDRCRDDAEHGHGPCYECGPRGNDKGICGRVCCPNGADCLNGKCASCSSGEALICVQTCPAGQALQCVAACGTTGAPCASGTTCCAGVCVNTGSDAANCGGCGAKCAAGQTCSGGKCTGGAGTCTSSTQCPSGQGCCSGTCVALNTLTNCGACGILCTTANGSAGCVNEHCVVGVCNAGFADCDNNPANGCEVNTSTDPRNCGACGNQCLAANGTAACLNGVCTVASCNPGFGNCDGTAANGCEANLMTDIHNCGACGVACATGQRCAGGVCVCDATSCPNGCCDPLTNACLASCAQSNSGHICRSNHQCGCGAVTDCPALMACGSASTCSTTCVPAIGSMCNGGCCSNSVCVAGTSAATCGQNGMTCLTCATGQSCVGGACV